MGDYTVGTKLSFGCREEGVVHILQVKHTRGAVKHQGSSVLCAVLGTKSSSLAIVGATSRLE